MSSVRSGQLARCHDSYEESIPAFDPVELRRYFSNETADERARFHESMDRAVRRGHPHIEGATQS